MDIKLYYWPRTRTFRVRWLLEELAVPYQLKYIDLFKGEAATEAYRKIHPLGYLPAVEIDGRPMFESGAICAWLTDQFPERKLAPAYTDSQRREYEQWMYFVPGEVEPPIFYHQLHDVVLPENVRARDMLPWLKQRYEHVLKALQAHLDERAYLLGDEFTTADIMLASTISWAPAMLTSYPALERYVEEISSREAWQRAKRD